MVIWALVIVGAIGLEAATTQLVAIWFMPAALAAMITSLFTDNFTIQLVVFVVSYALCLLLCRKAVKRFLMKKPYEPTNAEAIVGEIAVVTEAIDNVAEKGEVKIQGKRWSARSVDGGVIETKRRVRVERIEGVKLICSIAE